MKKLLPASAILLAIAIVVSSFINVPVDTGRCESTHESRKFAGKWTLDKGHSNVKFTVTHMVVSEVDGSFKNFDGTIESTKPDFSDAVVNFTVDVTSVDTDNENRDKHLKSDDFFNGLKYVNFGYYKISSVVTNLSLRTNFYHAQKLLVVLALRARIVHQL